MKQVTVYQYARCGTCRKALKTLKENGYDVRTIEVFEHPPSADELMSLIRLSGLPAQKFLNTSGEVYREMKLKDRVGSMTDEEKAALMSTNGRLIKRPIVTDGKQVTVGFKEDQFRQWWS